ncbi:MAG TPA: glycine cleavage system aminomethyltransferase GcvT [Candidatus Dormibacteraeota bacterium]
MTTSAPNLRSSETRRTPLYDRHVALGGRMVDFGGWDLPQQYTSIRDEHLAVRKVAGLFDVSHMGRFRVTGGGSFDFLQAVVTNDLGRIERGMAQYNLLCKDDGGVVDDLIVYWGDEGFFVVVNASNREKDLAWMREHAPAGVTIEDRTFELALLAFQGPRAEELMPSSGLADIPYFGFRTGEVAGVTGMISRTGYTGEDGFEIFVAADRVGQVWDAILEKGRPEGVLPAGLGARDAARLEAALRLYGNDMDEAVNPYEAGLGWAVKLDKGEFVGREALAKVHQAGPRRTLIGIKTQPGDIPRHGAAVKGEAGRNGVVTSGTHSFFLGHPIALAMVEVPSFRVGDKVAVEVRGREAQAEVVKLPFYRGSARSALAPAKS